MPDLLVGPAKSEAPFLTSLYERTQKSEPAIIATLGLQRHEPPEKRAGGFVGGRAQGMLTAIDTEGARVVAAVPLEVALGSVPADDDEAKRAYESALAGAYDRALGCLKNRVDRLEISGPER